METRTLSHIMHFTHAHLILLLQSVSVSHRSNFTQEASGEREAPLGK
ncbi:MAG: hypothetical protein PUP93_14275 [Rhizonema sp. NSF051]|nr:hypothetical protein [Rhizonema sp. NSF051]